MRTVTGIRSLSLVLMVLGLSGCVVIGRDNDIAATPQRPTLSSDTSTTAVGTVEAEAGAAFDPHDSFDLPLSLKIGLTESAEVFSGWSPYRRVERPGPEGRGQGDWLLGTRIRLLEQNDDRPSAALQLQAKIPTGDEREGLSTGEADVFAAGIVTKDLGRLTATGFYQLGFLGEPVDSGFDVEHSVAIAAATEVYPSLSIFGEAAGIFVHEQSVSSIFTTFGAAYALAPSLVLDAAVVRGLSDDAPNFQFLVGLTANLGRLWRP